MQKHSYDILCIGNYTKDKIITPDMTKYVDGGAINYAAHAIKRLGFEVAVLTRLAEEDQGVINDLEEGGIDCYVDYSPFSTTMILDYPTSNPDIRTLTVNSIASPISVDQVDGLQAKAAVIGPSIRGEVGLDVIKLLREKNIRVAADMQGYVRVHREGSLIYEPWPEMAETLQNLDVVKTDAVEAEFLTGESDMYKAAATLSALGPREIVLTHKDGVLVLADGKFYENKFFTNHLIGRSGRGDTCIGSYMAFRTRTNPRSAATWAAAVTSMKMEKLGPFDRNLSEVRPFIAEHYPDAEL